MNIQTVTGASPKTKKTSTWVPDAGRIVCVSCNLSSQLVSFTLITAFSTQLSLVKALQKSDAHGFNNPKATRSPGSQAKSGFLKIERSAANQLGRLLGHWHPKTSLAKTWGQVLVQIWGRFDESNSKVAILFDFPHLDSWHCGLLANAHCSSGKVQSIADNTSSKRKI
jgi:hypothetical protein